LHVSEEKQDRDDARGRREQGVLQGSQPEYAHARLAVVHELLTEGMQVDGEATAGDKDSEARRNQRERPGVWQARTVLDPGDLAIGQDIADVRKHIRGERKRKPARIYLPMPHADGGDSYS